MIEKDRKIRFFDGKRENQREIYNRQRKVKKVVKRVNMKSAGAFKKVAVAHNERRGDIG